MTYASRKNCRRLTRMCLLEPRRQPARDETRLTTVARNLHCSISYDHIHRIISSNDMRGTNFSVHFKFDRNVILIDIRASFLIVVVLTLLNNFS